jgi:hypothetical protein
VSHSIVLGGTYELRSAPDFVAVRPLAVVDGRVVTELGPFDLEAFLAKWKLLAPSDWTVRS